MKLLNTQTITEIPSLKYYIYLIIKNPVDYIGIYYRHFAGGLLSAWPSMYVYNIYNCKIPQEIITIVVYYIILLVVTRKEYWKTEWFGKTLLFMIIPVICITPGAVEARFFLPMFIFAIATVLYSRVVRDVFVDVKKNPLPYACGFAVFAANLISVWTSIFADLRLGSLFT